MLFLLLFIILGLCWGSFLNVVAYRLVLDYSFLGRSFCDACSEQIAVYDLIPVVSYCILKGSCRNCKNPISILYPLIELLTAILFLSVAYFTSQAYWIAYWLFFSSLIVTIRMDFESMLISEILTLGFIPIGLLLSYFNYLPITVYESLAGAILGYLILYILDKIFTYLKGQKAIGDGDIDLLAMIGAFVGPLGVFYTLFIGSILGSLTGIFFIYKNSANLETRLPFGPWLSFGSIIYVLFSKYLQFI